MNWIAVHEEVLGGKLRGLRKSLRCSEAEALGILTFLWLWARKNADISGYLMNTDKDDIAIVIEPSISKSLDALAVTEALVQNGWIDEKDEKLYIHDWYEWQQHWYNYLEKKEKDRNRKRIEREKARKEPVAASKPETNNSPSPKSKKAATKPKEPPKVKFAEKVSMTQAEYDKLVSQYGVPFVQKCIEKLDNYKASSGKTYKEDYRAILNWVVDEIMGKYPKLAQQPVEIQNGENPFGEYK